MGRVVKKINLPKRVLILCEGESEQIYLKGLKKANFNRNCAIDIEMYQPNDYSPLGLMNEAKKKIIQAKREYPYYAVWIVFDKDDHKKIDQAFNVANQNKPVINISFSNICFEYWVLLHFEQKKRAFQDSSVLISYIEKQHRFEYSKTMNIFEALKDSVDTALNNCNWLHQQNKFDLDSGIKPYELDAYTNFDHLYSFLINIIKQEN